MRSGIEIKELIVGTGKVADRTSIAIVHLLGFLRRGDEICNTRKYGQPEIIDLGRRDHVAGLQKGIQGMRVGGRRELIVSPHLAYGEKGIPGSVPPHALIRFEVELLDVLEPGRPTAQYYPPSKQLLVFRPGEAARNLARWQFCLNETESSAGALITHPIQGVAWRHARAQNIKIELSSIEMAEVSESVQSTFVEHPAECLKNEQMWADSSEKANSISRDRTTNELCVSVTVWDHFVLSLNYGLPESSPVLLHSKFYQIISKRLAPYLMKG